MGPGYDCGRRINKESADNAIATGEGGFRNPAAELTIKALMSLRQLVAHWRLCAPAVRGNLRRVDELTLPPSCSGFLVVRQCYSPLGPEWRSFGKPGMEAARKSKVHRQ